jgi:ketosteroid isomerase-like protein
MPEDNVAVVRRLYDAWARDEIPGPADLLHPDVEYVNPDGAIEPGTRRGLQAFAAAVEKTLEGWETWEMEPEQFTAAGDQVAVVLRYRATARRSGIKLDGRESALLTVRGGKILRYEWFHGPEGALRALAPAAQPDGRADG